jgi:hypothetical protein
MKIESLSVLRGLSCIVLACALGPTTITACVNPAQRGSQPGTVRVNPQDGLDYVWIPAGTYTMGCSPSDSDCDSDEKPSHSVTISKGFWMGADRSDRGGLQTLRPGNRAGHAVWAVLGQDMETG